MGRYTRAVQGWITGLILVTILVTAFLPDWMVPAQAAPAASSPDAALANATNPLEAPVSAEPSTWEPRTVTSTNPVALWEREASRTTTLLSDDRPIAGSTNALNQLFDNQTSLFLYGKVAVKVLFVESAGSEENWTSNEVNSVKTEVAQALDWWTAAATTPASPDGPARPSAHLTWDVSYISPFDGDAADRPKIQLAPPTEPIQESVFTAAANWIPAVATKFVPPGVPTDAAVRTLADNTRDTAGADWGFVLFVVDSSNDEDGFFNDDLKAAGAALNGPWAVVAYDAGDFGTDNLEVLIAKMIGHVFGAGDETYGATGGCYNEEIYGYLRQTHDNCERGNLNPVPSLMRDGQEMLDAYQEFQLSASARAQVGWRDRDEDGIYDVVDTLSNTFSGVSSAPVCPVLQLANINIANVPARPDGVSGPSWGVRVWDPEANAGQGEFKVVTIYTPANINRPSFVWGRINGEEWLQGMPSDGAWDEELEAYTLSLLGEAGSVNQIEVAILDRWGKVGYMSDTPVVVTIATPATYNDAPGGLFESNDANRVALFNASGLPGGWTDVAGMTYSGNNTKLSGGTGSEACFAFTGIGTRLLYNNESNGVANVYVDGELHSTIGYTTALGGTTADHYITNLLPGNHTVQIEASSGTINFDAFVVFPNPGALPVIDLENPEDFEPGKNGFYEQSGIKLIRTGQWSPITLNNSKRPAPQDGPSNNALQSVRPNDRLSAYVTHANVAAIYRRVFPGGGTAYVYVDGEFRGIMNNNAAYTAVMPFYIGGLDPNTIHSIELRVNPDAPRFDFDALRLLNLSDADVHLANAATPLTNVSYDGAQETYGVWEYRATGTFIRANDEGDLQNVFFKGSAVAVLVRTSTDIGGIMELYVDGQLVRTVNLKVKNSVEAPIVLHGFDSSLPHVLQIRHHNLNPAAPKWSMIDGYRVYYIAPVAPEGNEPKVVEEYIYDGSGNPVRSDFIYEQAWKFSANITAVPGPSENRYIQSKHPESRAYLYFTGVDTLTLYAVARDIYGSAELWVDGKLRGTFNLYSGSVKYNVPYTITGMNPTTEHVLEVRIKDMKKIISIDRVILYNRPVLGPGTYENDGQTDVGNGIMAPAIQLSGQWKRVSQAQASGGTYDTGGSIEDQIVFSVKNATSVVLYRRLYSKYGLADVYVDGQYRVSFDSFVAAPINGVFQQPFVISGLNPGYNHEIRIVPRRFGAKSTLYKPLDIDYIVVRDVNTSGRNYLLPGTYENDNHDALSGGAINYVGNSWTINEASRATIRGEKAVVVFQGNALTVFFNKASNGGKANISIDGKLMGSFNTLGKTANVPFTIGGLGDGLHTAEIQVMSYTLSINAFQVHALTPVSGPATFDLNPVIDNRILVTDEWTATNEYLRTNKKDAKLLLYVTGGDTLIITHEAWAGANNIDVYINGQFHSRLDTAYLRQVQTRPESTFILSGLTKMRTEGVWVEIRNPAAVPISLRRIEVSSVTPALGAGQSVEAEGGAIVRTAGRWTKLPTTANTKYFEGFFLQSVGLNSVFYIPTQEGVRYVTVYRSTGTYGDAKVYIDGQFWGTMPNKTSALVHSTPFIIGPIRNTPGTHMVEIRPATTAKIALDRVTGHGANVLQSGNYENTDTRLLYTGNWRLINHVKASGGSMQRTGQVGAQLTATFVGNEITFTYSTSSYGGLAMAYVDGIAYPINTRSGTVLFGVKHTILLPSSGPHSLVLVNRSGRLDLDAVSVRLRGVARYGAYQNDSAQVALSNATTWATEMAADHSGGTYAWTDDKYASAFFLFNGQRVTIYSTTGKDWGKVSIYVDGKLHQKVVQFVKNQIDTPFYAYDITGLPQGNHVLEIRFEGERLGLLGKRRANFDVITVDGAPVPRPGDTPGPEPNAPRNGCFQENSDEWRFYGPDNAWTLRTNPGASGNQYYEAEPWTTAIAEFRFAAAGFSIVYHKGPEGGEAYVYVDGNLVTTLDMYSASNQWLNLYNYTTPALNPNVVHVVEIVHAGGGYIYVDRIDLPSYNPACPN